VRTLELPPMAAENGSRYGTPFTVSIEARHGISTGVSAADRVTTVRAATAPDGLQPAAVLCELMNPDGTMMRGEQIEEFAALHGFPILTIAEMIEWRKRR
jgi:3,4-dihydroxy 2-butanone 4-phosphate synthase